MIGTTQKTRLQFRYGTQAKVLADTHDGLGLLAGEPAYSTDTKRLFVSDGSTNNAIVAGGSGTLTAGTTTTVTDALAKTTSIIMIQATSAAITLLRPYVSTKNNGSFVITTLAAAGTETFDYMII